MSSEESQTVLSKKKINNVPIAALARVHLLFFARHILGLDLNWHHREWAKLLEQDTKRLLIECARSHGKSVFFTFAYPLWLAFRAKKPFSICVASFSQDQSTRLVTEIKREIERNPYLKYLMPEVADTWGKTSLYLSNGVSIVSESFGSSVRGGHFNFLIVDDPVKDFGGMNREDVINFFTSVFLPTLNPYGQIIVVGTPVDKRDLIYRLENNPAYTVSKYPAIINEQALWPERYSIEMLNQIREEMGSAKFNREYLLQLVDSETAIFKEEWIRTVASVPEGLDIYFGIDLAIGQKKESDYFALVVVGADKEKNLYVLDYIRGHYTLQQQIEIITRKSSELRPIKVAIESVAYQAALPRHLITTTGIPIREVKTNTNKTIRAERLSVHFENGKIKLREGLNDLIEELIYFPSHRHDDLVDALGFAVEEAMVPKLLPLRVVIV